MDSKYRVPFSSLNGVYDYGTADIKFNDPILDWPSVPEIFNSPDMMFFGISSLRIETGSENAKLLLNTERTTDFKLDS